MKQWKVSIVLSTPSGPHPITVTTTADDIITLAHSDDVTTKTIMEFIERTLCNFQYLTIGNADKWVSVDTDKVLFISVELLPEVPQQRGDSVVNPVTSERLG